MRYSLSAHSLLFRIVVSDFMSLGADLQWVSAFPDEAEVRSCRMRTHPAARRAQAPPKGYPLASERPPPCCLASAPRQVLYPPLTYLKPTGRMETVEVERDGQRLAFTVVEVSPFFGGD